jgi:hypothetical protein
MMVTLKYAESILATGVSGAMVSQFFQGSSLYDPNLSGVGHQPFGFDQYTPFFQRYYVTGVRAKLTAVADANSWVAMHIGPEYTSVPTSVQNVAELPRSVYGVANLAIPLKLNYSASAQEMYGITDNAALASTDVTAPTNASPTKNWFIRVYGESCDASSTTHLYYMVEIEYDVIFFERLQPGAS